MKKRYSISGLYLTFLITVAIIISVCSLCNIYYTRAIKKQLVEEHDKVEFYEKVIKDLGMDEFVNYPDIYYQEDYVDENL